MQSQSSILEYFGSGTAAVGVRGGWPPSSIWKNLNGRACFLLLNLRTDRVVLYGISSTAAIFFRLTLWHTHWRGAIEPMFCRDDPKRYAQLH